MTLSHIHHEAAICSSLPVSRTHRSLMRYNRCDYSGVILSIEMIKFLWCTFFRGWESAASVGLPSNKQLNYLWNVWTKIFSFTCLLRSLSLCACDAIGHQITRERLIESTLLRNCSHLILSVDVAAAETSEKLISHNLLVRLYNSICLM